MDLRPHSLHGRIGLDRSGSWVSCSRRSFCSISKSSIYDFKVRFRMISRRMVRKEARGKVWKLAWVCRGVPDSLPTFTAFLVLLVRIANIFRHRLDSGISILAIPTDAIVVRHFSLCFPGRIYCTFQGSIGFI